MKKSCDCKNCDCDKSCDKCSCSGTSNCNNQRGHSSVCGGGGIYGLGFLGAAFFFIGHATSFWMGVLGFLQALVWPAFLVYEMFKFLIK